MLATATTTKAMPVTPTQSRTSVVLNRIQHQREAYTGDYELNLHEVNYIRRQLYALNKNNDSYRYRTMYEVGILRVWRFRKGTVV